MVIVKSEWLNLRLLVTEGYRAALLAQKYLHHSFVLVIAHTGR